MTFLASRRAPAKLYNLERGYCAADYRPEGKRFSLTLLPEIGEQFPAFQTTEEMPPGCTAPPNMPLAMAWRTWIEINGEVFGAVVADFHSILPGDRVVYAWALDSAGKTVKSISYPGIADPHHAVNLLLHRVDFDRNAAPVDAGRITTTINPPDMVRLRHTWSATINPPDLEAYTVSGSVTDLRERGVDKPEKWQRFKSAHIWPQMVAGRLIRHLIALDDEGVYHIVSYDPAGKIAARHQNESLIFALATAASINRQFEF